MVPTISSNQSISIHLLSTIGSGDLHGYATTLHTTGDTILITGDHTTASTHTSIGIIATGTTTITPSAHTDTYIVHTVTTTTCTTMLDAMTMHTVTQSVLSLLATHHATSPTLVPSSKEDAARWCKAAQAHVLELADKQVLQHARIVQQRNHHRYT
jgi:hypothetical protein